MAYAARQGRIPIGGAGLMTGDGDWPKQRAFSPEAGSLRASARGGKIVAAEEISNVFRPGEHANRDRLAGRMWPMWAIEIMVWEGSCRTDAANAAGLRDHSLREALPKLARHLPWPERPSIARAWRVMATGSFRAVGT
jgi:hypothetical protein